MLPVFVVVYLVVGSESLCLGRDYYSGNEKQLFKRKKLQLFAALQIYDKKNEFP